MTFWSHLWFRKFGEGDPNFICWGAGASDGLNPALLVVR